LDLEEFDKKVTNLKNKIEKHIFHSYLRQFIIPSSIDEDKLILLILIVEELEISPHEKELLVQAIALMNIALDTHDDVSNTLLDENSMKIRQLTVLAGDYYSGLYYKYLSEIGDVHLIKSLSEGVKDINEHKVSVYHKDQEDLESIINSVKTIEFSLFEKLTSYYDISYWNESTSNLLLIKRLIKEINQYKQTGTSVVFNALERLTMIDYSVQYSNDHKEQELLLVCERYIENAKKLMINGIKRVPRINHLLEKRMIEMIKHHYPLEKSFVEEG
jgi:heptaprenyl diphosphate synthase